MEYAIQLYELQYILIKYLSIYLSIEILIVLIYFINASHQLQTRESIAYNETFAY